MLSKAHTQVLPEVTINGIWFSPNGVIPEQVVNNLSELAEKAASQYDRKYAIIFWTDVNRLEANASQRLHRAGVRIRDYREATPVGEEEVKVRQLVDEFVQLGSAANKLPYAMASDLLRMQLLFKSLPREFPGAVNCYIDCNDIIINLLPDPEILKSIDSVAFNFLSYKFNRILGLSEVLKTPDISSGDLTKIINNDLIVAAAHPHRLENIFNVYVDSLCDAENQLGSSLTEAFRAVTQHNGKIDEATSQAIVFGTTHTMNIFSPYKNDVYIHTKLKATRVDDVRKILRSELPFTYVKEQGQTWLFKDEVMSNAGFFKQAQPQIARCKQWKKLIQQRVARCRALVELAENNIDSAEYVNCLDGHPLQVDALVKGIIILKNEKDILNKYIEIIKGLDVDSNNSVLMYAPVFANRLLVLHRHHLLNDKIVALLLAFPDGSVEFANDIVTLAGVDEGEVLDNVILLRNKFGVIHSIAGCAAYLYGEDRNIDLLKRYLHFCNNLAKQDLGEGLRLFFEEMMDGVTFFKNKGCLSDSTLDVLKCILMDNKGVMANYDDFENSFLSWKIRAYSMIATLETSSCSGDHDSMNLMQKLKLDKKYRDALTGVANETALNMVSVLTVEDYSSNDIVQKTDKVVASRERACRPRSW